MNKWVGYQVLLGVDLVGCLVLGVVVIGLSLVEAKGGSTNVRKKSIIELRRQWMVEGTKG